MWAQTTSRRLPRQADENFSTSAFLFRREVIEHFVDGLTQLVLILFWLIGKRIARPPAPDQVPGSAVVHIKHQRSHVVVRHRRCSRLAKTPPTPSRQTVIERLVFVLVVGGSDSGQSQIAARFDFLQAFGL